MKFRRSRYAVLALAGSGLVLAGCGTSAAPTQSVSYGPNNTVVTAGDISDAVTLDPQVAYEFSSVAAEHQLYDTLVKFPPGNLTTPVPSLATSWSVSSNGQTWTFHLRPGVTFSSGDPVTAQDVVYTFERVVNLPNDPASWLVTQTGLSAANVGQLVKAVNPSTVSITLPQPFSQGAFLAVMANSVVDIVDSKVVKAHVKNGDWGTAWLYNHSAGTGPYVLDNWTKNVEMDFTANPHYNLGPAPSIKRVVWKNVSDTTTRLDMLKRGNADVALGLTTQQIDSLKGNPKINVIKVPQIAMQYLGLGVQQVPALGSPYVREALKYAVDYQAIVSKLLDGNGTLLQGIIPRGIFGYTAATPFSYDPAKAKALLAQGGYPNGFSATMLIPNGTVFGGVAAADLAEILQSNFAAIGVHIQIRQLEASQMYTMYRAHQAQMVLAGWGMDYPDPQDFAAPFGDYTQKSLIWRLQDNNQALSALVEKAAAMANTPARAALYQQINTDLESGPFIVLYQPDEVIAYSKTIHHLTYDDLNGIDYANLTK